MAYLTESFLRDAAQSTDMAKSASQYITEFKSTAITSIFLSHSHKDKELAKGMIIRLGQMGIAVYVDWNDSGLPRITDSNTANKIKQRIDELKLFMVLATQNVLNSRWVPWEIGVADKTKGESKVLIIPVVDYSGQFKGSEYLQLYRRAELADGGMVGIFEPDKVRGTRIDEYVRAHG